MFRFLILTVLNYSLIPFRYTAEEVKPKGRGNYTYTMQICPDTDKVKDNAGVVQIDDDSGKTARVLGRFNETDAILSARGS